MMLPGAAGMSELDRTIHEPVRLRMIGDLLFQRVDLADFNFMLSTLRLSKGNLTSPTSISWRPAGYLEVRKSFSGKMPHTEYRLTDAGRTALADYWAALDAIHTTAWCCGVVTPRRSLAGLLARRVIPRFSAPNAANDSAALVLETSSSSCPKGQ